MRYFTICLTLCLTTSVGMTKVHQDGSGMRVELTQLMRAYPIGLAWWTHVGWRQSLSASDHLLLKGHHLEGGFKSMTSPASFHPGIYAKIQPISPLIFDVEAQQLRMFGLFGSVTEYSGRSPDWSPQTRSGPITQGRHETGWRVSARATIQLKLGPFFAQTALRREWLWMNIKPSNTWYDPTTDLLFDGADVLHRIDSTLGVFMFGSPKDSRYLIAAAHWQGYWIRDTKADRHIVGGLILSKPGWWAERQMVIGLLVGVNAVDVHRDGQIYAGGLIKISWERIGKGHRIK